LSSIFIDGAPTELAYGRTDALYLLVSESKTILSGLFFSLEKI
jgi:hypothetical protein